MMDNSTKDKLENETPHFGNTLLGAVPSEVFNEDCITVMKRYPDKFFDLAVYDPYAGTGTTLKVAKSFGLKYFGSEINSNYCRLANKTLNGTLF